jgi:Holliday junction resolvase
MKLEKDLWRELKRNKSKISWTRLENRALFGTPDLLGYAPSGNWFLVELKLTKANKVRLSPHQIAFFCTSSKKFICPRCRIPGS